MPKGNYVNSDRKLRYALLRDIGVPRATALLVRDWSYKRYMDFYLTARRYGANVAIARLSKTS